MLPLVYHPNYSCPFPENHRFVMSKFARLFRYIINAGFDPEQLHQPESASLRQLSRAHSTDYLQGLFTNTLDAKEWKKLGLPWSQGLIDRTQTAPNGTLMAARLALQYGLASHLAGGTHHAHYDHGSGFCLINDLAYTALTLLDSGEVKRVLIFDLDVHQGDGTATILANEPNAFTCSIHCGKNFPFTKANSDLDIELEKGLEDQQYLTIVSNTLNNLLDELNPDLVIYDAGVDVWKDDPLGMLCISMEGIKARDEGVLKTCLHQHIPITTVIGGGYDKNHNRLAQRHGSVIETAQDLFEVYL